MELLTKAKYYTKKTLFLPRYYRIKRNFSESNCGTIYDYKHFMDSDDVIKSFIYKDENWNYIKNRFEYRKSIRRGLPMVFEDNLCLNGGGKYTVKDNSIVVKAKRKKDNWLCFYLKDLLPNKYKISFNVRLRSEFTEVQLSFNSDATLGERYRFILRDNREIAFECAYCGEFYNHLFSKPMSLELNKDYRFEIIVSAQSYSLYIDGINCFNISERKRLISGGNACLILWNYDEDSEINCILSDFKVMTFA